MGHSIVPKMKTIEALLALNGAVCIPGPEHSEELAGRNVAVPLMRHFGLLFADGRVIVAVDKAGREHVVHTIGDMSRVWNKNEIDYALSMPATVFERIRGDIAIAEDPP